MAETPNPASGNAGTPIQATQAVPTGDGDKIKKDPQGKVSDDAQKAADDAQKASEKAQKARNDAEQAKLSDEEKKARELEAEAGLARSKAALAGKDSEPDADTVKSANMLGMGERVNPDMKASDHLAQKFGNDPANPKPPKHVPADYDGPTVRLSMKTPDLPEGQLRFADVHPDSVGDYLRAGWNSYP